MHDLRLVGVHEDGEHLLLSGPSGEQYLLTVDESLRAAVRRDRAHLGQLQIEMSGELRPREVQAQIRAGATADEVAARSGWPVDRVRRYEGAVLAERAHITDLARAVTLRRRGSDTTSPTLSSRVEQRLAARGVEIHENGWDSWRAEDGPWMVTLRFLAGGREREARWLYDPVARTVSAQDDEALWLSEDEKPPAAPTPAPHLSAVPTVSAVASPGSDGLLYDLDADGGLNPPEPLVAPTMSAVDLVGAMRQRRHGRRRLTASEEFPDVEARPKASDTGAAGRSGPPAVEQEPLQLEPVGFDPEVHGEPPAAHPFPFPERLRDAKADPSGGQGTAPPEDVGRPQPAAAGPSANRSSQPIDTSSAPVPRPRGFGPPPATTTATSARGGARPTSPTSAGSVAHSAPVQPPGHRRARRASVPSWDEIMFGGKRD
jgi:hypothetical protein